MSINKFYVKKWSKMIFGKSILHVDQGIGKSYKKNKISGYYNDLTEKIIRSNLKEGELPLTELPNGDKVLFSIAIFQYGLGAYDLYLQTRDEKYLTIFKNCVNWTVNNQDNNGGWKSFQYDYPKQPYSSMAQGEAISLLSRAYIEFNNEMYLSKIKQAMKLLIKPVCEGGVADYCDGKVYLKEFVNEPVVLNGWIFSIWGVYDYLILFPKDKKIKEFYKKTLDTLIFDLPKYDLKYWSKYDMNKKVASPFYHKLHIHQLEVLYDLTGDSIFKTYSQKFNNYNNKKIYKMKAFIKKTKQKIFE